MVCARPSGRMRLESGPEVCSERLNVWLMLGFGAAQARQTRSSGHGEDNARRSDRRSSACRYQLRRQGLDVSFILSDPWPPGACETAGRVQATPPVPMP